MSGNQGNQDNASKLLKTVATTAAIGTAIMAGAYLWNNYFDKSLKSSHIIDGGTSTSAKPQKCTICWEMIENDVAFLPCTHTFHKTCIKAWNKNSCPICRETF